MTALVAILATYAVFFLADCDKSGVRCVYIVERGNCHSRANGNLEIPMNQYYLYILASRRNGTLYIGVTNNLIKRVYEHKNNFIEGFTKEYRVHQLVYYEETRDVLAAITREKQMKKWNRAWKIELIEKDNSDWKDLYSGLV